MATSTLRKPMHQGSSGPASKAVPSAKRVGPEGSPWLVMPAPLDTDTQSEGRKPALGLAIALTFSTCFWVAVAIWAF